MHNAPRLLAAGLLLLALAACSDDTDDGDTDDVSARSPLAVITATDTDAVPESVSTNLPGGVRTTKLLTNEELQLHDCTRGELTDEAATVTLGWAVPNRGLTAFVQDGATAGVCDLALANGAVARCSGGPERFADLAQLETAGGDMSRCVQAGTNASFLSVVVPEDAAWLAVQQGGQWDVYKIGDRPLVRVIATEGLNENGDRITLTAKVLDTSGAVLAERTVTGAVAG